MRSRKYAAMPTSWNLSNPFPSVFRCCFQVNEYLLSSTVASRLKSAVRVRSFLGVRNVRVLEFADIVVPGVIEAFRTHCYCPRLVAEPEIVAP